VNRVFHFEIPAEDTRRATSFYQSVFGWSANEFAPGLDYWLCQGGAEGDGGMDGAIMARNAPSQPVVNTIQVESVDTTIQAIERAGGQIVVPKMAIPGFGYKAYFKDTEGNIFGVAEMDSSATV